MRALVLGCGSIGRRHTRNLVALSVEVVVSDLYEHLASSVAADTGALAVTRTTAPPCELVVVATPTVNHVDDLEWALRRGADVFVEKPLASTRSGLATARALAAANPDRNIMVGCSLRFSEGFSALSAHLADVGRTVAVLADYGWWLPSWRPSSDYRLQYSAQRALGGGIVLDAIHEIDYTLELAGPVDDVVGRCTWTGSLDVDVEDIADISMRHRNGVQSTIHLDYLRRKYSRSCTVIGTDGQITWDVPRGTLEVVREPGAPPDIVAESLDNDPNTQYMTEMRRVVESVGNPGASTWNGVERAASCVHVALTVLDSFHPPKTVAIIQARMGSSRLPGKVLTNICGKPMLAHVIERVSRAHRVDQVVVATTLDPLDDAVAQLAAECGADVTRGSTTDVLGRYVQAAEQYAADVVVRVTADCPLTDPELIDRVVHARVIAHADYASNVMHPTYPEGYDVEVLTSHCLRRLDSEAVADYEREHVTARIREHPDRYRTADVLNDRDLSAIRLTVDVVNDLDRVCTILSALPPSPPPDLAAVVRYLENDDSLRDQDGLPKRDESYRAQRDAALHQETSE